MRLHRVLAEAGVASRRGAERLIREGRVTVNAVRVLRMGVLVDPARDAICVDGERIQPPEPKRYVLLHKPRGYLTTRADPRGRPCVFDLLPDLGVRLHAVGRLDYDSEGLLLLTNDGAVTYALTHPRHGAARVYHVWVDGAVTAAVLARLERGVILEDGPAHAESVRRLGGAAAGGSAGCLEVVVREGRYREVRRMCRAVGLSVRRLVRVRFGPLVLGGLDVGGWRELGGSEVVALRGGPVAGGAAPPARPRGPVPGTRGRVPGDPAACTRGTPPLY